MAVDWRNPVNALDVNGDGATVPIDVLNIINELNSNGARRLADVKDPSKPYWDTTGDQFLAPLDALPIINALNDRNTAPYQLEETSSIVDESTITVTLGQPQGTRTYRLRVEASFDASSAGSLIEDVFAVYLVDPSDPSQTLLDRGASGTALFTLSGAGAELRPGITRWDGSILEIDLSSVEGTDTGVIKLQLIGAGQVSNSKVTVRPLSNEVDTEGFAGPTARNIRALDPGGIFGTTPHSLTTDVSFEVANVRLDSSTGRMAADISITNDGIATLSRNVAIAFPGLPPGVTLRNSLGLSGGTPLLNFGSAIPRGGLAQGARSELVRVEFENPQLVRFDVTPQVLTASNTVPQLPAIGSLTVAVGSTLEVPLQAGDADGDRVNLSIESSAPLPNSRLRSDGTFEVQPTPDQVGTYSFTVIASDGMGESRQVVSLDVVNDASSTTRVSGRVLDVDLTPLAGMQVEIGSVQSLTQDDGTFVLDLGPGPIVSDTLKVRGETYEGDAVYPFIAEKLPFILEHEIFAGVDNVIDRPIFLPKLDVDSGKTIDPNQDTTVTTPAIPGAAVLVKAGTLMDQQGTPFTGVLSITQVPTDRTPAALPTNLIPDLVVTIQPGEMVFATPAPLSLPNLAGWAPGSSMELWSINPVTGEFDLVGSGRVSPDGQVVETVSGGIRNSSWHFFSPRLRDPRDESEQTNCDVCVAATPAASTVELHTGALQESHRLPTYQSQGRSRGIVLHYDSLRAHPQPVIQFSYEIDGMLAAIADAPQGESMLTAKASLDVHGMKLDLPGAAPGTFGLAGGEHFFRFEGLTSGDVGKRLNASLPVGIDRLPTGIHKYQVDVGVVRIVDGQAAGATEPLTGELIVVDRSDGPLGAGWGIEGHRQLNLEKDGSVLMIDGDGSEMLFRPRPFGPGTYDSPPGHFGTLEQIDGGFRHTTSDQTVSIYDPAGRPISVTDRNDNRQTYEYDDSGRLIRIVDPVGLVTAFGYAGDRITTINDPAGRATRLEYDSAGNLIRIAEPNQPPRSWMYDSNHQMIGEATQRGFNERVTYDWSGRVTNVVRADGSTMAFITSQARSLHPLEVTRDPATAPEATVGIPHEAIVVDPGGEVVRYALNEAGLISSVTDRIGLQYSNEYNEDFLTVATTDGRGVRTTYEYDGRGNLIATRDIASSAAGAHAHSVFALRQYAGPSQPEELRAVDINGDGNLDVVAPGFITVTFGRDDGTFEPEMLKTGIRAAAIDSGDFNGDAKTDLVLVQTNLQILAGDGAGGFEVVQTLDTGAGPVDVVAHDFNEDGRTDFATANSSANSITVLMALAGGGYSRTDFPTDDRPTDVEVSDMDRDGRPDLLVLNEQSRTLAVHLNLGNGQFQPSYATLVAPLQPGSSNIPLPTKIAVADLNGDLFPDVVIAHQQTVSILLNDRLGGFGPAVVYGGDMPSNDIDVADMDQDGDQDLVVDFDGIFLNNGDGTFGSRITRNTGEQYSRVVVDVDRDGLNDIVYGSSTTSVLTVNHGIGRAAFEEPPLVASTSQLAIRTLVGDVNSDGILDLVTFEDRSVSVNLGLGNGAYGDRTTFAGNGRQGGRLVDFDQDGNLDLLATEGLHFGRGDGSFDTAIPLGNVLQSAAADVNDDNRPDLILRDTTKTVAVRINQGSRTFALGVSYPTTSQTGTVVGSSLDLGDVNGDGRIDIVALNSLDENISVLLGLDGGAFAAPLTQNSGSSIRSGVLGDWDGDSKVDLAVIESTGSSSNPNRVSVMFGKGDGTFEEASVVASAGSIHHITAADIDRDGAHDVAIAYHGNMIIAYGSTDRSFKFEQHERPGQRGIITPYAIGIEDINGDGRNDLLVPGPLNGSSSGVFAFLDVANRPRAVETSIAYDPTFSQPLSITDELGNRTEFELDPQNGNILKVTRVGTGGDNVVTQYTYTQAGLVDRMTDPLGVVTDYDYDEFGRLTTVTFAAGRPEQATRRFEYDEAGDQARAVNEKGQVTEYFYDVRGRLIRVQDAVLGQSIYEYDAADNLVLTRDQLGNENRYEHDPLDRLTKQTNAADELTTYVYDPNGNLLETRNAIGESSRSQYDARNRRTAATNESGETTRFTYDAANNLISLIDADGNRSLFDYDNRNRVIARTDPTGKSIRNAYDAADRLIERRDRNGRVTKYEYDALGRVANETWLSSGGTTENVLHYHYDAASNLLEANDLSSEIVMAYDARYRIVRSEVPRTSGPDVLLSYSYDASGNPATTLETIDGTQVGETHYTYDAANRLITLTQFGPGVAEKRVDFEYDAAWRVGAIRRFGDLARRVPAVWSTFSYDAQNRPTDITHSRASNETNEEISFFRLSYDAAGRVRQLIDVGGTVDYLYDGAGQLTSASHSDAIRTDETYTYSSSGNRSSSHLHGDLYEFDDANRLTSDGSYTYEYDHEGNVTRRTNIVDNSSRRFSWDHRNRLIEVSDRSASGEVVQTVRFKYDALNRRIEKEILTAEGAKSELFVYDRDNVILKFDDPDGSQEVEPAVLSRRYLHGLAVDQVLAEETPSGEVYWHLADHLGTIHDLATNDGELVRHSVYDSFGRRVEESGEAPASDYGFTGREFDSETGLYYYRSRYYDAGTGRMLSEDPLGFAAGDTNLYRYVQNRPTELRDPDGMQPQTIVTDAFVERFEQALRENLVDNATFERLYRRDAGFARYIDREAGRLFNAPVSLTDRLNAMLRRPPTADDLMRVLDTLVDGYAPYTASCAWRALRRNRDALGITPSQLSGEILSTLRLINRGLLLANRPPIDLSRAIQAHSQLYQQYGGQPLGSPLDDPTLIPQMLVEPFRPQ